MGGGWRSLPFSCLLSALLSCDEFTLSLFILFIYDILMSILCRGDSWHRLREQDFSQVEGFTECSTALQTLIASMMSKDPASRPSADDIYSHVVITRARSRMDALLEELRACGESSPEVLFKASPLAAVDESFLSDILGANTDIDAMNMDCSN